MPIKYWDRIKVCTMDRITSDSRIQNHTSLQYALLVLGDGICPYVNDKFKDSHNQIKQNILHATNTCTRSCSQIEGQLQNWYQTCLAWRTVIIGFHTHKTLAKAWINWKSIDSSRWPNSILEVKKCFYPEWCLKKGATFEHDDVSVIINCMKNCKLFRRHQHLDQTRRIRNEIAHKKNFSDQSISNRCNVFLRLLTDSDIKQYEEARNAIKVINILKDNTLKDISDKQLIEEQYRTALEVRLYGKTKWLTTLLNNCRYLTRHPGYFCGCSVFFICITNQLCSARFR